MASPRTHRSSSRLLAAATAIAFVLAGVLGALHQTVAKHIRCAEHGELTHAEESGANHSHPLRETAAHEAPRPSLHEHEHCLLATALRSSTMAPRVAAATAPHLADDRTPVVLAEPERPALAPVYRTAPKTSPPA